MKSLANVCPLKFGLLRRIAALLFIFTAMTSLRAQQGTVAPEAESEDVTILPEFTVTTSTEQGYVAPNAVSGSRTGARLTETPFSVQVITNEFMSDFQLTEMADQLRFVAGAFSGAEDTGANNGKTLRGFNPPILRDGFSRAASPNRAIVDRVEIIRGPVSTLYGQSSPGGLVNYITKRAKRTPVYSLTGTVGSYDFKSWAANATGPLVANKLYYNATYAHDYTESDLQYYFNEKDIFALGATYLLSSDTQITAQWERNKIESNQGDTIPLLQVTTPSPTRSVGLYWDLATFNVMGPYNILHRDFESGNILIEHRFSPDLTGRINLQTYDKDFDENQYRYGSGVALVANGTMTAEAFRQEQDESANLAQADLLWKVTTGNVKHAFLLAADVSLYEFRDTTYVAPPVNMVVNGTTVFRRPTYTINPFAPVWPQISDSAITQLFQDSDREINSYGAFVSHRMFLFDDKLVTMAGLRYDNVDNKRLISTSATGVVSTNNQTPVTTISDGSGSDDESLSYTLGLNYKIRGDGLVWYVNNSTGFEPKVTIDRGTAAVVPNETSRGVETGFKGLLFDDTFVWSGSIFKIEKENVAISNPAFLTPGGGISEFIFGGQTESKGYEIEGRWNVNSSFYIQAGGSFVDARVTDPEAQRDRVIKSPRYVSSMATRYLFRTGPLKGFKIGASMTYTGDYLYNAGTVNAAGVVTRFRQVNPAVTLYNAFVGYTWRTGKSIKHTVQVNGMNLTDEYYLQDTLRLARGREYRLTYTLNF